MIAKHTHFVKATAKRLGFDYCGISKAEFLAEEAPRLEAWLKQGMHGNMHYMENHFDKRLDPTILVPGAKTVVSLLYNYYPADAALASDFKLSKYAYGEDYHQVIKAKLAEFMDVLIEEIGAIEGRVFVDSAPVLDKAWAKKSGLGWVGKNTNLITKEQGSFFFIAELILDLELEVDGPIKDYCGTCTKCIDACPTDAIEKPYLVNGSKCISYFTIELKEAIPAEMQGKFNDWMFGCDICQDVCPWNRFSKGHKEPLFKLSNELSSMRNEDWRELSEDVFKLLFKKSPVARTKFTGLKRNIDFLIQ